MRTFDLDIKKEYPPNYREIVFSLGDVSKFRPVFVYGRCIYNPFERDLTPDVIFHESIHAKQQEVFPTVDMWYLKYLNEPAFRLECEKEAYGEQYAFARRHGVKGKLLTWIREQLAIELSSAAYGRLMTISQADTFLRRYTQ